MGWNTLSTHIKEKLAVPTRIGEERCMYKVSEQLRDVNEKAYKPTLLAIGPYHHGKVGHGFMEEHKWHYLQQMLIKTKGSVEAYIIALRELEEPARKCYAEYISQTSDQFVEMMLLDGCFIIELFRKYAIYQSTRYEDGSINDTVRQDPIFRMTCAHPKIARDLLLFENQIPFFVLEKLFKMIQNNETRSNNLGECYPVKLEEKLNEISTESSTSADRPISRELYDLALRFFSDHLPLEWHVDKESFDNSTKMIASVYLDHEALTLSHSRMVWDLSMLGFRFKNTKFEHLLGLIHATICISILDIDIGFLARERLKAISDARESQGHGFQVNMAEKYEFEVKMEEIEGWESIPYSSELQEAGVGFDMAKKLRDDVFEFGCWLTIPYAFEFQEAGIEFKKAKKFSYLLTYRYWNEDRKSKPSETGKPMDGVELMTKFEHLICADKIERWKSIPYGEELRDAGVEFNKAKQFKRLFDLREFEDWNIHGATELEEAGIKFKTARRPGFSIKFNNGLMEISPLTIEDHTETYLRNLIAYEQYCDKDIGFNLSYVTNYVRFMDDLINSPKDVQLLRRRRIIRNLLGDDEVVSNMFKKLGQHITISTSSSVYARTSMVVNMHCSKRWNLWVAKLRREYFSSPWALLSFLAAILLLALAITQTVFSIIP